MRRIGLAVRLWTAVIAAAFVLRALVPMPGMPDAPLADGPVIVLCGGGSIVWYPLGEPASEAPGHLPADATRTPCADYALPLAWLPAVPEVRRVAAPRPLAHARPAAVRLPDLWPSHRRQARAPPGLA